MKRSIIAIIFCLLIAFSTGCSNNKIAVTDLIITGDIEEKVNLSEIWATFDVNYIDYKDSKIHAVDAQQLTNKLSLIYGNFDLYLKAYDGFMVKISGDTLPDTYIGYDEKDKWVYVSKKHPVNSGIKHINEIIIVKNEENDDYSFGLNIILKDKTINYSIGQLLTKEHIVYPFVDGVSSFDYKGKTYNVDVMKQRKFVELSDIVDEQINNILIMDELGNYDYIVYDSGYVEIGDGQVNYIVKGGKKIYRDIEGIIVNPPKNSVMDTAIDTIHYLEKDKNVLIIFIDGFSYKQYQYLKENESDLFLSQLVNVKKANAVFKPVTNAGFGAMITGQPPVVNGILNREYRQIKVDTIFDIANKLNKKSILIEGDVKILNTNISPQLNIDKNGNGTKDDEIFNNAMKEINNNYDLFVVHFHSLDDYGHMYGAINDKIVERINVLDEYTEELVEKWDGKVIIVSDHGMHDTKDGGSHGEFRAEDMFVPYVITNGGLSNEKK